MAKTNTKKQAIIAAKKANKAKARTKRLNAVDKVIPLSRSWSKRVYIKLVAEGITKYTEAAKLLITVDTLITTVHGGLTKYPMVFGDAVSDYLTACNELSQLVIKSTTDLEYILDTYLGVPPAADATPEELENLESLIPKFIDGSSVVNDWLFSLTTNIYETLGWVESAADLMDLISRAGAKLSDIETTKDIK